MMYHDCQLRRLRNPIFLHPPSRAAPTASQVSCLFIRVEEWLANVLGRQTPRRLREDFADKGQQCCSGDWRGRDVQCLLSRRHILPMELKVVNWFMTHLRTSRKELWRDVKCEKVVDTWCTRVNQNLEGAVVMKLLAFDLLPQKAYIDFKIRLSLGRLSNTVI